MCKSREFLSKVFKLIECENLENIKYENQNIDYEALVFTIGKEKFRSRLGKLTPKKQGYFVAFWEKNDRGVNVPYSYKESPGKLIINIIDGEKFGQFILPKDILLEKNILSDEKHKGKMAARFYPPWELGLNKTALKTQEWQGDYFINLGEDVDLIKLKNLYFK